MLVENRHKSYLVCVTVCIGKQIKCIMKKVGIDFIFMGDEKNCHRSTKTNGKFSSGILECTAVSKSEIFAMQSKKVSIRKD